ncbi:bifunctional UDP-sugar hydrolase/5'-nucleotidase [Corynebacterium sp.]|uniref:bifunctional metallophosphatase/5'-nucleotidase n=1 Tax=Corynebacterium sp. TaxID=1720 RepID=UPI002A91E367|nr:bifunctional UDP-sugar hydrolase/5'-nucleotidase [Corynebacterium sp.]MDY5785099.1 bifunctional UDP-sugar hydrolase/5'-nucleotidase [Corynebacterium sp.]
MRLRALTTAVSVTSVSALALAGLPVASAQDSATFAVSNITDFHGYFADNGTDVPGALHLKCAIDEFAGESAHAFTSSGDNVGASAFASMILDDAPTIDVLNQMGLDVSAVGNHEFDAGQDDLVNRIVPAAEWTYLAANAEGLDKTDIRDYRIMDLNGVNVAFVGAVTQDMPNLVSPAGIRGITWHEPVETINSIADELTASGEADVVIALPHEGAIPASAWSDNVDVVFMGHSHEFINQSEGNPLVLQAGFYSQGLANVEMTYDAATDTVTFDSVELLNQDNIRACGSPDELQELYPEIAATIAAAQEAADAESQVVIGQLDMDLYRGANEGEASGSNRGTESQLNNLLAEVAKWAVGENSTVTPDIGVMNAGGVRADLLAGDVTAADVYAVQPFNNPLTFVTLKGSDFVEALEQQWKDPAASRPFLSLGVSNNVSYTYDETRPQGERITNVLIDGEPIDPNRDYVVAGSTFLLSGGDGFTALANGSEPANLGYIDVMAFTDYLRTYLSGGDAPAPRTGQSNVAVHIDEPLKAGEEATIDISSLIYTQGETASTVTVELGSATVTAPIDSAFRTAQYNESGRATVTIAVPQNLSGEQRLRITTDAGTDVWVPVTVTGVETPAPDMSADSSVSPLKSIILAIVALIGLGSLFALVAPHQIDRILGDLARFR